MSAAWPSVALGDVIKHRKEFITIDDLQTYRRPRVQLRAQGIVLRDTVPGALIKTKKQQVARAGEFLVAEIDAKVGGFGIVPNDLDGAIVSSHYFLYGHKPDRLDNKYLGWFIKTPSFRKQVEAQGSTNYAAIRPDDVLGYEIPLPPLDEQHRVVARLEELAVKVKEALSLRAQSKDSTERLSRSVLRLACMGDLTAVWRSEHKGVEAACDLLDRISQSAWNGHRKARDRSPMVLPAPPEVPKTWSVTEVGVLQEAGLILDIQDGNHGSEYPRKAEFVSKGIPFVTAKQIYPDGVDISRAPRLSQEKASRLRIGFARGGDVLLTHNASVGDVALAPDDAGDFVVGTSVTYWRCNSVGLNPRYVYCFLKSVFFQDQLAFIMKQTTRNQVSVLKQVNLWMCVPPIEEQAEIVRRVDTLTHSLKTFTDLQAETAAELDAMLPAILDKAFKGEL